MRDDGDDLDNPDATGRAAVLCRVDSLGVRFRFCPTLDDALRLAEQYPCLTGGCLGGPRRRAPRRSPAPADRARHGLRRGDRGGLRDVLRVREARRQLRARANEARRQERRRAANNQEVPMSPVLK